MVIVLLQFPPVSAKLSFSVVSMQEKLTMSDPFPLPRVEDLLDRVCQASYLTKLNMTRGYWLVPLDNESVPISAFVKPFGYFQ